MSVSSSELIETINRIFVEDFELDATSVVPDAKLRADLDLDSLDAVDLIVAIERAFGIRLDDKKVMELITVGDVHTHTAQEYGQFMASAGATA